MKKQARWVSYCSRGRAVESVFSEAGGISSTHPSGASKEIKTVITSRSRVECMEIRLVNDNLLRIQLAEYRHPA